MPPAQAAARLEIGSGADQWHDIRMRLVDSVAAKVPYCSPLRRSGQRAARARRRHTTRAQPVVKWGRCPLRHDNHHRRTMMQCAYERPSTRCHGLSNDLWNLLGLHVYANLPTTRSTTARHRLHPAAAARARPPHPRPVARNDRPSERPARGPTSARSHRPSGTGRESGSHS